MATMKISIVNGSGEGATELSAFDSALMDAGISNQNLIYLSSVIPPGSDIDFVKPSFSDKDFGSKLYIVISEMRTAVPNKELWVGVGWVQDVDTKKGLFVEHHGDTEKQLRAEITKSLRHMTSTRKSANWGEIEMATKSVVCNKKPVSVLIAAVYQLQSW
jgi:arginine decarboxylase